MKITHRPFGESFTWEDIPVGMICYHIWANDFRIKTGKKSYFSFDDRKYHTMGKLLTEHPTEKRNFIPCSYDIWFNDDLLNTVRYLWYERKDHNGSGREDK